MSDIEKLAKAEDDVIYPPAPAEDDITVFYFPSEYFSQDFESMK